MGVAVAESNNLRSNSGAASPVVDEKAQGGRLNQDSVEWDHEEILTSRWFFVYLSAIGCACPVIVFCLAHCCKCVISMTTHKTKTSRVSPECDIEAQTPPNIEVKPPFSAPSSKIDQIAQVPSEVSTRSPDSRRS